MHIIPILVFAAAIAMMAILAILNRKRSVLILQTASDAGAPVEADTQWQRNLMVGLLGLGVKGASYAAPVLGLIDKKDRSASPRQQAARRRVEEIKTVDRVRLVMQVVLSLLLLGASLCIILIQSFNPNDKHWAYGTVGTILGYWFKK